MRPSLAAWRESFGAPVRVDSGRQALTWAADNGRADALRSLREDFGLGAEDARVLYNHAITIAAEEGHVEVLRELRLGYGLGANDARAGGAIGGAAANNQVEALSELREGYRLEADDARADNNKALYWAARCRCSSALRELREGYHLGADDARAGGNRALSAAIVNRDRYSIRELRAFGLTAADAMAAMAAVGPVKEGFLSPGALRELCAYGVVADHAWIVAVAGRNLDDAWLRAVAGRNLDD